MGKRFWRWLEMEVRRRIRVRGQGRNGGQTVTPTENFGKLQKKFGEWRNMLEDI